jgi:hypothetical protein
MHAYGLMQLGRMRRHPTAAGWFWLCYFAALALLIFS